MNWIAIGSFVQRWAVVALAVAALLACVKMVQLEAALAESRLASANEKASRESAARAHETILARREQKHAAEQQEKEGIYGKEKSRLAESLRSEQLVTSRMRQQLAAATARSGSGSATDPAACQRAINKLDQLGGLAGEGLELLVEGRGLLAERDLDVQRLRDQVTGDRKACGQTS